MSTLSQFTGGSSPAIGEFAYPPSTAWSSNQTVGSKEYLQTGTVKAYSSPYATLAQIKPLACSNATNASAWLGNFTASFTSEPGGGVCRSVLVGGNYHTVSSGNGGGDNVAIASNLTTTTPTVSTYGRIHDAELFNGYSILGVYDGSGWSGIWISTGSPSYTLPYFNYGLANGLYFAKSSSQINAITGGNLTGTAGEIVTSTNGASWTNRTPSGYAGNQPRGYYWSQPANVFVLWTGNASAVQTSPNGYDTWTTRTQPADYPASSANLSLLNSMRSATSPSATIWLHSTGVIIRNTTVSDFTAIDLRTTFPIFSSGTCYLMWDGSRFVIVHTSGFTITSSDGQTWLADYRRFSSAYPSFYATNSYVYGANMSGTDSFIAASSFGNAGSFSTARSARLFVNTGKYGNATPDFVGMPAAQNVAGNLVCHVRIA